MKIADFVRSLNLNAPDLKQSTADDAIEKDLDAISSTDTTNCSHLLNSTLPSTKYLQGVYQNLDRHKRAPKLEFHYGQGVGDSANICSRASMH